MAQIELTVCDVCERPDRGTLHYFIITGDDRRGEADLCEEHAKPIEHLLGDPRERDPLPPPQPMRLVPKPPTAKRATAKKATAAKKATTRKRTSLGAKVVTSLEDIEKLKH